MKRIAVVTTSRADFSHLVGPLRAIAAHPQLEARLIATAAHAAPEFGSTLNAVRDFGIEVDEVVECLLSSDTDLGMAKTIGVATLGISEVLARLRPDVLLLIADRYEMLAPAAAALALRIPVAHIEGGDVSAGAIDDAVRNALTKLSHLHFTPTERARRRVLALGEEAWRVQRSGAPSLDLLRQSTPRSRTQVNNELGLRDDPYGIVAYHPVTLMTNTVAEADALYDALDQVSHDLVFCFPNADAGARRLVARAETFCESSGGRARLFVNIAPDLYWDLLRHAVFMLGNSSSGIMETPAAGVPAVDIGARQGGRELAANTLHAAADPAEIIAAVGEATSKEFRQHCRSVANPYGDGRSGLRIAAALAAAPDRARLLYKRPLPVQDLAQMRDADRNGYAFIQ